MAANNGGVPVEADRRALEDDDEENGDHERQVKGIEDVDAHAHTGFLAAELEQEQEHGRLDEGENRIVEHLHGEIPNEGQLDVVIGGHVHDVNADEVGFHKHPGRGGLTDGQHHGDDDQGIVNTKLLGTDAAVDTENDDNEGEYWEEHNDGETELLQRRRRVAIGGGQGAGDKGAEGGDDLVGAGAADAAGRGDGLRGDARGWVVAVGHGCEVVLVEND